MESPVSVLSNRVGQLRLKHLSVLEAIDTFGSLSGVAKHFSLTQPAITAMVQELEGAFQTALVDRGRNGARLTAAGEMALIKLRLVFNTLAGMEKELAGAPEQRHLRVGILSNAMLELVPSAVAKMFSQGLNVTFRFHELSV